MSNLARASITVAISSVLVAAYAFSFVFAQGTPKPTHLPVAVVGTGPQAVRAVGAAKAAAGHSFAIRRVDDAAAARRLIKARRVYAALVPDPMRPVLLTAPAAGVQAEMAVQQQLPKAAGVTHTPHVEQVRPLVSGDPTGSALNVTLLPAVIFGTVMALLLTILGPDIRVFDRLGAVLVFAVLGAVLTELMVHTALEAIPGSFFAEWGVLILALLGVSATTTALLALLGPPGINIAILVFLIFGNIASGAQVQNELLPGVYRVFGPWLPPGATAQALRNIAYFDGHLLARPLLVLAGWCILGLVVSVLLGNRRPAAAGSTPAPTADKTPADAAAARGA